MPIQSTQEAYSHEVISFGFWAGDDTVGDATYYSYTAPEPDGTPRTAAIRGQLDRVRRRLAGGASLRDRAQRPRSKNDAAGVLPERLRGRRSPRRLGHQQLRIEMVSYPRAAEPAPRHRRRRVRPPQGELLACRADRAVLSGRCSEAHIPKGVAHVDDEPAMRDGPEPRSGVLEQCSGHGRESRTSGWLSDVGQHSGMSPRAGLTDSGRGHGACPPTRARAASYAELCSATSIWRYAPTAAGIVALTAVRMRSATAAGCET